MNLYKNSDNTHEIYGRNDTRSFDTDSSKDGFERVETYHRDVYGRIVNTERDISGDNITVNSNTTMKYDIYGRSIENISFEKALQTLKTLQGYDIYSRVIESTRYSGNNAQPHQIIKYKFDSRGREISTEYDKNANSKWDAGDIRYEFTLDNRTGLKVANKITENKAGKDVVQVNNLSYDEYNRRTVSHQDTNQNGEIDGVEANNIYYYIGESTILDKAEYFQGKHFSHTNYLRLNKALQYLGTTAQSATTKEVKVNYEGWGTPHDSVEDYTTSTELQSHFKPFEGHVSTITLSGNKTNTDITLDNDVVMRLAKDAQLTINGDATDHVRLKDYSEFKHIGKETINQNQYDKLTTTDSSGKVYTLLVDSDVHLYDADKGTEIL